MRLAFLVACLLSSGCVVKSLCPEGYEEGDSARALDCQWDFCRGHPGDSRCVDAATPDGSVDASADGAMPVDGTAGCTTWYGDSDGDGDGDPAAKKSACTQPPGYVGNADDRDPRCGRKEPSAGCTPGGMRCVDSTVGNRQTCTEDVAFPGCTDWKDSARCGVAAPVCSGDGACGRCARDSDCAGFEGTKVCDTSSGSCVQCTPATEVAQCKDPNPSDALKAPACEPRANTCTGAPRDSIDACQLCVSDTECINGLACVPTKFNGAHGNFCLKKDDGAACPVGNSALREATSILGVTAFYCFPDEALTTCEAVADFQSSCTSDDDCGAAGVDDGKCMPVGASGAKRCTYECDAPADCSAASSCFGAGPKYCRP